MNTEIDRLFFKEEYYCGRMISGSKSLPAGEKGVFNGNLITKTHGKIWFGDVNITKDGEKLRKIARQIGEPMYLLREMDCRFETENEPIETLISKAVERFE